MQESFSSNARELLFDTSQSLALVGKISSTAIICDVERIVTESILFAIELLYIQCKASACTTSAAGVLARFGLTQSKLSWILHENAKTALKTDIFGVKNR